MVLARNFGMSFTHTKCKVLLQDWLGAEPMFLLDSKALEILKKFTYIGSCISVSGLHDKISKRTVKNQNGVPQADASVVLRQSSVLKDGCILQHP